MMVANAQRKLREARFFLTEMKRRDRTVRLDGLEEFGFLVSAFLSAAFSVQEALKNVPLAPFSTVRQEWLDSLEGDLPAIVNFIYEHRRLEVHQGEASASQLVEGLSVFEARRTGVKGVNERAMMPWAGAEGATLGVARFMVEVDGKELSAVETCGHYLTALEGLVARCTG